MMENLKQLNLFKELSIAGQQLLSSACTTSSTTTGEHLLRQGDPIVGAYLILSGRVRIYVATPNGRQVTLYFLNPGDTCLLATNSLFSGSLYPANAEAVSDGEIAVIPGSVFRNLFQSETVIQDISLQDLSTIVHRLTDEIEIVHSQSVEQRLMRFLVAESDDDGMVRMTQEQIANHLGTTREMVARHIGTFVTANRISSGRGHIQLLQK